MKEQVPDWHAARATNAPTETAGNLVKKVESVTYGFRNFSNRADPGAAAHRETRLVAAGLPHPPPETQGIPQKPPARPGLRTNDQTAATRHPAAQSTAPHLAAALPQGRPNIEFFPHLDSDRIREEPV